MGKEISTSEMSSIKELNNIAEVAKDKYGISIWFAEIYGRRWSYVAGQQENGESLLPPERIELNERFGIVSDGWEKIPPDEREKIISSLKDIVG